VRTYEQASAVFSTMPPFQGGLEPEAETKAYGHLRESIDPDDFRGWRKRGGFAVWSGTSFAAPVVAGKIANALIPWLASGDKPAEAVARGWEAVTEVTRIALDDGNA
jgi:hypothetical protein